MTDIDTTALILLAAVVLIVFVIIILTRRDADKEDSEIDEADPKIGVRGEFLVLYDGVHIKASTITSVRDVCPFLTTYTAIFTSDGDHYLTFYESDQILDAIDRAMSKEIVSSQVDVKDIT